MLHLCSSIHVLCIQFICLCSKVCTPCVNHSHCRKKFTKNGSGKWKVSSHACFEVLTISSMSVHTDSYLSLSPARRAPSAGGNQMAPCYKSSVTSECVWVEERMRNKCTVWDQTKATVSLKTTCVIPLLKKGDVHLPCAQTGTW